MTGSTQTGPKPLKPGLPWSTHLIAALALAASLGAGLFELQRARSGNTLSWFYTFEWPGFGAAGAFVWITLIRENRATPTDRSHRTAEADPTVTDQDQDADLAAWRAYLAALHAADPPGGPPNHSPT